MQRNSVEPPKENYLTIKKTDGIEIWEVPSSAPTLYLSHNYLRYIGKFTPQLPHKFIELYTKPGDLVVDPMCGSGTTLIEALRLGRRTLGFDINDTALITSKVVTTIIDDDELQKEINRFMDFAATITSRDVKTNVLSKPLVEVLHYFDEEALSQLLQIQSYIDKIKDSEIQSLFQLALLSILRVVSKANVKKMNTELDLNKKVKPVIPTIVNQLEQMYKINKVCLENGLKKFERNSKVEKGFADNIKLKDESVDLVVLHPPYLSGTAFSETAQLQLAWLKVNHKDIRKHELAMRGSYFHVPNGLQKYLVGWNKILAESYRILKTGGYCACVIGDGSVSYTRIPMSPITVEFGKDIGFTIEKTARNLLNHNTGRTLNKKMKYQEIIVLKKT